MIRADCCPEEHRVTVTGHAQSVEYGRDLVCAACSALVLTLAADVRRMAEAGWVTEPVVRLEEGAAEIRCCPRPRYRDTAALVFLSVCTGFEVLAGLWPEHVSRQVHPVGNAGASLL